MLLTNVFDRSLKTMMATRRVTQVIARIHLCRWSSLLLRLRISGLHYKGYMFIWWLRLKMKIYKCFTLINHADTSIQSQ